MSFKELFPGREGCAIMGSLARGGGAGRPRRACHLDIQLAASLLKPAWQDGTRRAEGRPALLPRGEAGVGVVYHD